MSNVGEPPACQARPRRPRGAIRLLVDRTFGPFIWGKFTWSCAVWVHGIVAAIVVFDLSDSALVVGIAAAAQFVPQLLVSPLAGKFADRGDQRRQILAGTAVSAVGCVVAGAGLYVLSGDAATILVVSATLVVGLGVAMTGPAGQAIVPSLVREGELAAGVELNTLPLTITRAVGPAAGAVIYLHFGAEAAFFAAAAGCVFYGVALQFTGRPVVRRPEPGEDLSVRAALRFVWDDKPLLVLLLGIGAIGVGVDPSTTLAIPLAAGFGGGAALVGQLTGFFGAGTAAGFGVMAVLRRRRAMETLPSLGLSILAAGLAATAASPTPVLAMASFFLAGIGMTVALTSISTQVHLRTPDNYRGRVMALWMVAFLGSRPFAATTTGHLADIASVPAALLITATICAGAAIACRGARIST